ncbi:Ca2+ transporting ATPase [Moesziomyces antarcticus T-34]|uniref:Ca2+ transporting ATPase n=1 Tax=Pseudozyma antarctica (strain T-34) TaxID=1151754 RepID=M9M371_PSEA3|nr:Ca2+ transporting ATPase [Moesziomyces antarcticus T-34]
MGASELPAWEVEGAGGAISSFGLNESPSRRFMPVQRSRPLTGRNACDIPSFRDAKGAARGLVDEIKAQKAQKEREWAEQAKKTKVKRDKEGIAVIHCRTKATDEKPSRNVEVLFDNKD